jgi:hypothetical protein
MSRLLLIAAVTGATALSACAPMAANDGAPTASRSTQCFYANQVDNFRGNDQTLYVRTRNKDVFELETFGACSNIDFAFGIAFLPNRGINRLCTGDLTRVVVVGGGEPRAQCRVQVIKKLTDAEVMALPARDRP